VQGQQQVNYAEYHRIASHMMLVMRNECMGKVFIILAVVRILCAPVFGADRIGNDEHMMELTQMRACKIILAFS